MSDLLPDKPQDDLARQRYGEAMAGLLALGKPKDGEDYQAWAQQLGTQVPDLIRMVLDDDLNQRDRDDPAVWAPIHALEIIAVLGPQEAAGPLRVCLRDMDEWPDDLLRRVYAAIGPGAIPILSTCLEDSAESTFARGRASNALVAVAQAHPPARADVVAYLTAFLDRPSADASAAEETVTAFVIGDLGDLKATTAYEAIRRAFEQNRVDPQISALENVERNLGMRPPLDFSKMAEPPTDPGVRLALRCKACGRERSYVFPKVYYDIGTERDEQKAAQYDPLIIPQRVVCSKCGAVDRYELGDMGRLTVTTSLLAERDPAFSKLLKKEQRIQIIEFTTRWGKMHPQEAIRRYESEILRQPDDVELHLGYGNVMKFLGYYDTAEGEYRRAEGLAPDNAESWLCLAQLAGERGDLTGAIASWEKVLEVVPHSRQTEAQRQSIVQVARDSLRELRQGQIPEFEAPMRRPGSRVHRPTTRQPGRKWAATIPALAAAARSTSSAMVAKDS